MDNAYSKNVGTKKQRCTLLPTFNSTFDPMEEIRKTLDKSPQSRLKKASLSNPLEYGKLVPQAVELEEAVLGALMLDRDAVNDVIDVLRAESFYKESHQKIFEAIQALFQNSEPIDILTVTQELRKRAELDFVGGPQFISQLTNRVASAANVEFHGRIISQKHILRELIRISTETIRDAYEETTDVFDLLDRTEQNLFGVAEGNIRRSFDSIENLIHEAVQNIEDAASKGSGITGIETGFAELDKMTAGFQPSDMIILAARPGMGKTAFVLSMARNTAVEFNRPVAVFSLEMSSIQLVNRLIASESELAADKLKRGKLEKFEWEQLHAKIGRLSEAPLFIDDTPALSVFELRAKCRRLKQQHDISMIIIDYLQLMTVGGDGKGNREQEISTISRSIKSIAKELNVPIIALSQLNRSVETRTGEKRPQLSDLRESGAIEQDADMVTFIYRPEYYGITENEEGIPTTGMAELIIAKHRNGALGTVYLKFQSNLAKFTDMDRVEDYGFEKMPTNDDFDPGENAVIRSSRMDDIDNYNEDDADLF